MWGKNRLQLTVGGGVTGRGGGGHFGYGKKGKIKGEEEGELMSCSRARTGVLVSAVWVVSTTELVGVHAKGGNGFWALWAEAVRHVEDGGGGEERTLGNGEGRGRAFKYIFEKSGEKIIWICFLISSLDATRSIG